MNTKQIVRNWVCLIGALVILGVMITNFMPTLAPQPEAPVSTPYVAYYYYKPSCPACRSLEPTIQELEEEYRDCVTLRRIDISKAQPQHSIRGVPTVVLETADGEVLGGWVGAYPKEEYTKILDEKCGKER